MDKLILKKIAKRWSKCILEATCMDSEFADEFLSPEEQNYVVDEVMKIAGRICDHPSGECINLDDIIEDYYECDTETV